MLVDRYVARGEGEQLAGNTLRIGAGHHRAHEAAADAPALLVWRDAEPAEMPTGLRGERLRDFSKIGGERLVAVDRLGAPCGPDRPPARRIALLLGHHG